MGDNGVRINDSDDERSDSSPRSDDRPPAAARGEEPSSRDTSTGDDAANAADYVAETVELATNDPEAAGDRIGDLLDIAREREELRDGAGEALESIGWYRPNEFEVWVDDLVAFAESSDDDLAFLGLRALAQLAAINQPAASKGLSAAFSHLGAPTTGLRQAALTVVAEVGSSDPAAVRRADRPVAAALRDDEPGVRTAAAVAAGRLLGADPAKFPRTATTLLDALDDDDERVREFALVALANFAREHPENVPERETAIKALAGATDEELGLRSGALSEALSGLLALELGFDIDLR